MIRSACLIHIVGVVQGVGFRPFVYNLAISMKLTGWVKNLGSTVDIHIEACGQVEKEASIQLDSFVERLQSEAPPLSKIRKLNFEQTKPMEYNAFEIYESSGTEDSNIYISYDVSTCQDCINEIKDKSDRRYLYPFTNCTNCGPRFTIIQDIPYDRKNTTMREFPMCDECEAEYRDPTNRRYHAQPVACHKCGPRLILLDKSGTQLNFNISSQDNFILSKVKLYKTIQFLKEGKILAIKGLGGYHLACDAQSHDAVATLRKRKIRDDKPFAIMVKDYEVASRYCYINEEEKKLLESDKKPIVLLRKKPNITLSELIAPGNKYIGVMLPYTPLHVLIFEESNYISGIEFYKEDEEHSEAEVLTSKIEVLVMTSGNKSGEPIYYKDGEAIQGLSEIADYFLIHNREIDKRVDDSVSRVFEGEEYLVRRSRGYVPAPISINPKIFNSITNKSILAVGGELKSTFCISRDNDFFLSHHIGDLENLETMASFEEGITHFTRIFQVKPQIIAHDLHPRYLSTQYALQQPDIEKVAIQHHHAHIASCMLDSGVDGEVIGVAFDGTGYGEDGNLWGGEFFVGGYSGFKRAAHLEYTPMPGGELAVKQPWRMALAYIWKLCSSPGYQNLYTEYVNLMFSQALKCGLKTNLKEPVEVTSNIIKTMLENNINSPNTSSAGRLFDAVAALCGIRHEINYEGQAAIELEYILDEQYLGDIYSFGYLPSEYSSQILTDEIIKGVIEDLQKGTSSSIISSKFHATMIQVIISTCEELRKSSGLNRIALSGGVFQNVTLLSKTIKGLTSSGFKVFIHRQVPSNDGGICLGQAAIASRQYYNL